MTVNVIGAGLAGCEAAYQLARHGIDVTLYEMKPEKYTPAHSCEGFAELVCSNSFRAEGLESAIGVLKQELSELGSLIMDCAHQTRVPAGGAMAVDREGFSSLVTSRIKNDPHITVVSGEVTQIPDGYVIIATGPLTSDGLSPEIERICGTPLHFFDAAAPIVQFDSIDLDKAYFKARYDKGGADYINCPMDKDEYDRFYNELISAEEAQVHGADEGINVFEGCMPIEIMAKRGYDTMRFGPLKPVGLEDPKTGKTPYAVVQLRRDNAEGTMYNIVGFQTHLKFGEQKRVFSMIPGLENAEFFRYGVMHRNTYLQSPGLLSSDYSLKKDCRIYFAGQMTGVEGYIESASSGFVAGLSLARRIKGAEHIDFSSKTAIGSLAHYISEYNCGDFQPMNVNFGIFASIEGKVKKSDRKRLYGERALKEISIIKEKVNAVL